MGYSRFVSLFLSQEEHTDRKKKAEKILRCWSSGWENFLRNFLSSFSVTPSYHSHSKMKHQNAVYSVASRWHGHRFAAVVEPHGNAAGKAAAYFIFDPFFSVLIYFLDTRIVVCGHRIVVLWQIAGVFLRTP